MASGEFKMIENEAKNRYNSIKQFHSVLRFCKPLRGECENAVPYDRSLPFRPIAMCSLVDARVITQDSTRPRPDQGSSIQKVSPIVFLNNGNNYKRINTSKTSYFTFLIAGENFYICGPFAMRLFFSKIFERYWIEACGSRFALLTSISFSDF